mgnify:CR=1 FL=1
MFFLSLNKDIFILIFGWLEKNSAIFCVKSWKLSWKSPEIWLQTVTKLYLYVWNPQIFRLRRAKINYTYFPPDLRFYSLILKTLKKTLLLSKFHGRFGIHKSLSDLRYFFNPYQNQGFGQKKSRIFFTEIYQKEASLFWKVVTSFLERNQFSAETFISEHFQAVLHGCDRNTVTFLDRHHFP